MIININSIFEIYKKYVIKSILKKIGIEQSLNSIKDEDLINFLLGANKELSFDDYKLKTQKYKSSEKNDNKFLITKFDHNKNAEFYFGKFSQEDICVHEKINLKDLIEESHAKLNFYGDNKIVYNFKTLKDSALFDLKIEPLKKFVSYFSNEFIHLEEFFSNKYAATFSYDILSILNWSYFGDSHKGYAIGYSESQLLKLMAKSKKIFVCGDVFYKTKKQGLSDFPPLLSYFLDKETFNLLKYAWFIYQKEDIYKFQEEFLVFSYEDSFQINLLPALKEIAVRGEKPYKKTIKSLIISKVEGEYELAKK